MSRSNQSARGKTFLLADLKRRKPNKQMKKQTQTRKSIQKNAGGKFAIKAFILVQFKSLIRTKFKRDILKKLAASDNHQGI